MALDVKEKDKENREHEEHSDSIIKKANNKLVKQEVSTEASERDNPNGYPEIKEDISGVANGVVTTNPERPNDQVKNDVMPAFTRVPQDTVKDKITQKREDAPSSKEGTATHLRPKGLKGTNEQGDHDVYDNPLTDPYAGTWKAIASTEKEIRSVRNQVLRNWYSKDPNKVQTDPIGVPSIGRETPKDTGNYQGDRPTTQDEGFVMVDNIFTENQKAKKSRHQPQNIALTPDILGDNGDLVSTANSNEKEKNITCQHETSISLD
ncbi:hypothetical protein L873DRAFT_1786001 [Choiromyces venosus 120613-1]|uniref:Uncharacterized protein n=1 Tax=Choiromyces venosus 120613-1 TaxID=1336337 RepID=A0A3N4K2H6_9PEZI|nr:hypothetical protein L873DRAFT_1786001 [Choiromyces venosus 120613-1]